MLSAGPRKHVSSEPLRKPEGQELKNRFLFSKVFCVQSIESRYILVPCPTPSRPSRILIVTMNLCLKWESVRIFLGKAYDENRIIISYIFSHPRKPQSFPPGTGPSVPFLPQPSSSGSGSISRATGCLDCSYRTAHSKIALGRGHALTC